MGRLWRGRRERQRARDRLVRNSLVLHAEALAGQPGNSGIAAYAAGQALWDDLRADEPVLGAEKTARALLHVQGATTPTERTAALVHAALARYGDDLVPHAAASGALPPEVVARWLRAHLPPEAAEVANVLAEDGYQGSVQELMEAAQLLTREER